MARKIGKAYSLAKGRGQASEQACGQYEEQGANVHQGIMANRALGQRNDEGLPFDYTDSVDSDMHRRGAHDSCSLQDPYLFHALPARHGYMATGSGNRGRLPSMGSRMERSASGTFQGKMPQRGLITIEAEEHRCLLELYYAVYDDVACPSASTEDAYLQALGNCNTFYADGDVWG